MMQFDTHSKSSMYELDIGTAINFLSKDPDMFEFNYSLFKARGAVQVGDTSSALGNCRTALLAILTTTDLSEFLKAIPKNSHTKNLWDMLSSAERVYSREDVEKLCDVLVYLTKIR